MKNSEEARPNAVSVMLRLCTICSFAKPTFCRSMKEMRNITTRIGIRRRAIFDITCRSSAGCWSSIESVFTTFSYGFSFYCPGLPGSLRRTKVPEHRHEHVVPRARSGLDRADHVQKVDVLHQLLGPDRKA